MKRNTLVQRISMYSVLLVIAFSCQKNPDQPEKTRTELLATGSWRLVSHTTDPAADLDLDGEADDTDVLTSYEACEKDDITSFSTNGTGTLDAGPLKCDPQEPQATPFIWQWKNNETVISIVGEDLTIVELTSSTLKVTAVVAENGVNYTQTLTFTH